MDILEEINNWKLESADENTDQYFFHIDDVKLIDTAKRVFVIGRKGTGKTAICKYFESRTSYNSFSNKLSFKNFLLTNCINYLILAILDLANIHLCGNT